MLGVGRGILDAPLSVVYITARLEAAPYARKFIFFEEAAMMIRIAKPDDVDIISANDIWISRETLLGKIAEEYVYVVFDDDKFVGWLRYGLFWDNTPYMNMLYLLEQYRGKGLGRQLVEFWENEMSSKGYKLLLTSSSQIEHAQHFYAKLGYKAIGSFTLGNEQLEIMFMKAIRSCLKFI